MNQIMNKKLYERWDIECLEALADDNLRKGNGSIFSGENGMVDVCTGHCDVLGLRIGELRPKALLSGLVFLEEATIAARWERSVDTHHLRRI